MKSEGHCDMTLWCDSVTWWCVVTLRRGSVAWWCEIMQVANNKNPEIYTIYTHLYFSW